MGVFSDALVFNYCFSKSFSLRRHFLNVLLCRVAFNNLARLWSPVRISEGREVEPAFILSQGSAWVTKLAVFPSPSC